MLPFDALLHLPPDALARGLEYGIGLAMGLWLFRILKGRFNG